MISKVGELFSSPGPPFVLGPRSFHEPMFQ